jgi:cytochrome oxidase Cu insertion factor (SCO1/SenC/PrrC family)
LFVVIALAVLGVAFLSGRRQLVRAAVAAGMVLCLADWVLIEDLGFLGGLGTDPNSMIPMILLFASGYLALTPVPVPSEAVARDAEATGSTTVPATGSAAPAAVGAAGGQGRVAGRWRGWMRPERLREALAMTSARSVTTAGSVAVIVLGAAPMAAASVDRNADPVIAQAIVGDSVNALNEPAPAFRLADQNGRTVTLASLRGKVVLLTFLDPVCVSDCPLIAQEVRAAGQLLGSDAQHVELVAIVLNPLYYSVAYTRAFDQQEGLTSVPDWLFLTGSPAALEKLWRAYGVVAEISPGGTMVAHSDLAFVIDRSGIMRKELSDDPGPGTASSKSSFAVLLSDAARQTLEMP